MVAKLRGAGCRVTRRCSRARHLCHQRKLIQKNWPAHSGHPLVEITESRTLLTRRMRVLEAGPPQPLPNCKKANCALGSILQPEWINPYLNRPGNRMDRFIKVHYCDTDRSIGEHKTCWSLILFFGFILHSRMCLPRTLFSALVLSSYFGLMTFAVAGQFHNLSNMLYQLRILLLLSIFPSSFPRPCHWSCCSKAPPSR